MVRLSVGELVQSKSRRGLRSTHVQPYRYYMRRAVSRRQSWFPPIPVSIGPFSNGHRTEGSPQRAGRSRRGRPARYSSSCLRSGSRCSWALTSSARSCHSTARSNSPISACAAASSSSTRESGLLLPATSPAWRSASRPSRTAASWLVARIQASAVLACRRRESRSMACRKWATALRSSPRADAT